LSLSTCFVAALSHKENVPLLQKVADKSFITPTVLRQYFSEKYNNTIAALQKSKAKLVNSIITQLEANYDKQIKNFGNTIETLQKSNERDVNTFTQQH
jgi:exonuclease VII large subunit